MLVKAVRNFAGIISMHIDQEREIVDEKIAKDLLRAGHVVEVKAKKQAEKTKKNKAVEVESVEIKKVNDDGTAEAVIDGREATVKPADEETAEAIATDTKK